MSLILLPSRGLASRNDSTNQTSSRDIAQEAFNEAVNLLKQEFADDPKSLDWPNFHQGIMNHAQLVAEFSRALAEIGEILPQTTLNAQLYANDHMRDAIAHIYVHLLQFIHKAIKWYRRGPAGRAISAIFKPFELSYKGTLDEIQRCANNIENIAAARARTEIRDIHVLLQLQGQRLVNMEEKFGKMSESVLANVRIAIEPIGRDTAGSQRYEAADYRHAIWTDYEDFTAKADAPRRTQKAPVNYEPKAYIRSQLCLPGELF
ncbi:hypothetical protein O1611_g529 [Lasiodiplodia mahajangana]|uniref:Uncharacterized protein n=1 Tax=Lasiodiplodia mahajangana TaxID=1108764 RepID=A0ACC2K0J8_9PEZI|nr:hypothetical protein O1611_g529 [Lasiodiplodia mahajangana]